jgi:hypothetical protein
LACARAPFNRPYPASTPPLVLLPPPPTPPPGRPAGHPIFHLVLPEIHKPHFHSHSAARLRETVTAPFHQTYKSTSLGTCHRKLEYMFMSTFLAEMTGLRGGVTWSKGKPLMHSGCCAVYILFTYTVHHLYLLTDLSHDASRYIHILAVSVTPSASRLLHVCACSFSLLPLSSHHHAASGCHSLTSLRLLSFACCVCVCCVCVRMCCRLSVHLKRHAPRERSSWRRLLLVGEGVSLVWRFVWVADSAV